MNPHHGLCAILSVMAATPYYRRFTVADVEWAIMPPVFSGDFYVGLEDGRAVSFATWHWLSDEALAKALKGEFYGGAYTSGPHLWMSNIAAPWGHGRQTFRDLRELFPATRMYGVRRREDGTVRKAGHYWGVRPWETHRLAATAPKPKAAASGLPAGSGAQDTREPRAA